MEPYYTEMILQEERVFQVMNYIFLGVKPGPVHSPSSCCSM
jgi:hypothetical protein